MKNINLNLIIPFKNEGKNIRSFFKILKKNKNNFRKKKIKIFLTFVNDKSEENENLFIKKEIKNYKKKLKIISNSENYGSHFSTLNGFKHSHTDVSLAFWSDLEINVNRIFDIIALYRKTKKPIIICYKNKYNFKDSIFSNFFWFLFSFLNSIKIKNFFSILVDKKNNKSFSKNIKITDLIFVKFFDSIKNYEILNIKLNERPHGKSKWTLNKKLMLFYLSLINNNNFIKFTIFIISIFLISINKIFIIFLIFFLYFEIKIKIFQKKRIKFSIKNF